MRILVTNDDGIYAPGLWLLVEALHALGDVYVVAPDREQSGVGSSVSLHRPLRLQKLPNTDVPTYTVDGTPADAVILALGHLIPNGVDAVVAGINEGSNMGDDVLLSGTVGAALQAYHRRIPSLAISVAAIKDVRFDTATHLARILVPLMVGDTSFKHVLLNVTVPNVPPKQIKGITVTRLARREYTDKVEPGKDRKRDYYWIVRGTPQWQVERGTDIWAVRHKRVSLTPIATDLTHLESTKHLAVVRRKALTSLQLVSKV
ncbi:MAG: 5'/3'-nucleotidase SurE [Chloroflexi bacterium]|nr:5'/3'-nucleotidase SurE [Chloroflexota bacterium]